MVRNLISDNGVEVVATYPSIAFETASPRPLVDPSLPIPSPIPPRPVPGPKG